MYFIYALYNESSNKIYVGQTQNLTERLRFHNAKIFKSSYTAKNVGSWKLIYKEKAATREKALNREKQLKSYQGRQFIRQRINNPE